MKTRLAVALLGALVLTGCGLLGGDAPSASPPASGPPVTTVPTAATSPSATPAASAVSSAPSASAAPTDPATAGGRAPILTAPTDILPPDSLATVVVDGLRIRREPNTAAAIEVTAGRGETIYIITSSGVPGPVAAEGYQWYPVYFAPGHTAWPVLPASGSWTFGWAAASGGGQTFLELNAVSCPSGTPDLATLVGMTGWARLACYSGETLTVSGFQSYCEGCGGVTPGTYSPEWLAHPQRPLWVRTEPAAGEIFYYRMPDDASIGIPPESAAATYTGHFDDPAATSCTMEPLENGTPVPANASAAVLLCREQFVVTATD